MNGGLGYIRCTGRYDNISFIIKTPFSFFVSFASSFSLGFPPGSSFPHSLPIFSPKLPGLLFSHLHLLLFPRLLFLFLLLLLWFFLFSFPPLSAFSSFPPSFLLLPLPFVCVFLPPSVPFSSSSFSVYFRCFLFLSLFAMFFHSFPFVVHMFLRSVGFVFVCLLFFLSFRLSSFVDFLLAFPFLFRSPFACRSTFLCLSLFLFSAPSVMGVRRGGICPPPPPPQLEFLENKKNCMENTK